MNSKILHCVQNDKKYGFLLPETNKGGQRRKTFFAAREKDCSRRLIHRGMLCHTDEGGISIWIARFFTAFRMTKSTVFCYPETNIGGRRRKSFFEVREKDCSRRPTRRRMLCHTDEGGISIWIARFFTAFRMTKSTVFCYPETNIGGQRQKSFFEAREKDCNRRPIRRRMLCHTDEGGISIWIARFFSGFRMTKSTVSCYPETNIGGQRRKSFFEVREKDCNRRPTRRRILCHTDEGGISIWIARFFAAFRMTKSTVFYYPKQTKEDRGEKPFRGTRKRL